MRQASLADAESVRRIDWLIHLRWFAVVGVAAVVTAARHGFHISLPAPLLCLSPLSIAPEEMARGFDEFYHAPDARALAKEGTGLGLSIAKAVVDAHRGTINVYSQLGHGTQFELSLPVTAGDQQAETKRGARD